MARTKTLRVDRHTWGDLLSGTKEQLRAHGLDVTRFPGEPGCNKCACTFVQDGLKVCVERRGAHRYHVRRDVPPKECRKREAADCAKAKERATREREMERRAREELAARTRRGSTPEAAKARRVAFQEATHSIPTPAPGATIPAEEAHRFVTQTWACFGLLEGAITEIQQRVGDSAKLARALEDVTQVSVALKSVTAELERLL